MEAWEAILLGVVEGLSEYLPISSTGHLLLFQRLLGMPASAEANAFAIAIQGGAILAVLGLYRARVAQMALGLVGRDAAGRRLDLAVAVAFAPAAVLGTLFDDTIERYLFGLWPVAVAWLVGGAAILALASTGRERRGEMELEDLGLRRALSIGLLQCVAMWPGTSRSLMTIAAGLLCGMTAAAAVEFSFLLGAVTLTAATAFKVASHGAGMSDAFGASNLALGFAAAALSAAAAVKWMVSYLKQHSLSVFGWYRVLLGIAVGGLLAGGCLSQA